MLFLSTRNIQCTARNTKYSNTRVCSLRKYENDYTPLPSQLRPDTDLHTELPWLSRGSCGRSNRSGGTFLLPPRTPPMGPQRSLRWGTPVLVSSVVVEVGERNEKPTMAATTRVRRARGVRRPATPSHRPRLRLRRWRMVGREQRVVRRFLHPWKSLRTLVVPSGTPRST